MSRSEPKLSRMLAFSFFIMVFLLLHSGCAMDGVKYLIVVDENGNQLKSILIVPLYSKAFGLGIAPEGHGWHTKGKLIVKKPFVFNSGEDLMSKKIHTRGVILPPLMFIGSSNSVDNWLFIKKGFAPKMVDSSDIHGNVIVLIKSNGNDTAKLIDMLLASEHDQNMLKKQFGVEWVKDEIAVIFNKKDIELLKTYK